MGAYSKWLLNKKNLPIFSKYREEDYYKIKDDLKLYDKLKLTKKLPDNLKDINKLTIDDLSKFSLDFSMENDTEILSNTELEKQIKNDVTKYQIDNWLIIIPKTEEASCYYGKNTKWCTAATKGDNMFDSYYSRGDLHILINKNNPKEKYQFHFEDEQFMDKLDRSINLGEFFQDHPNLLDFFVELNKDYLVLTLTGIFPDYLTETPFNKYFKNLDYGAVFLITRHLEFEYEYYQAVTFLMNVKVEHRKKYVKEDILKYNTLSSYMEHLDYDLSGDMYELLADNISDISEEVIKNMYVAFHNKGEGMEFNELIEKLNLTKLWNQVLESIDLTNKDEFTKTIKDSENRISIPKPSYLNKYFNDDNNNTYTTDDDITIKLNDTYKVFIDNQYYMEILITDNKGNSKLGTVTKDNQFSYLTNHQIKF